MTIANVAVMVALKRGQVHLNRDVILLAEGDEEAGGDYGIDFAVQKHWDKIAAGFALNEGGRVFVKDGRVQWVGIQASEKIPVNVIVTAKGTSGHASVPLKDNPIVHLSAAIEKIGNYATPWQLNSVTRVYFEQIAKIRKRGCWQVDARAGDTVTAATMRRDFFPIRIPCGVPRCAPPLRRPFFRAGFART